MCTRGSQAGCEWVGELVMKLDRNGDNHVAGVSLATHYPVSVSPPLRLLRGEQNKMNETNLSFKTGDYLSELNSTRKESESGEVVAVDG